jgi:hypothetical protein
MYFDSERDVELAKVLRRMAKKEDVMQMSFTGVRACAYSSSSITTKSNACAYSSSSITTKSGTGHDQLATGGTYADAAGGGGGGGAAHAGG